MHALAQQFMRIRRLLGVFLAVSTICFAFPFSLAIGSELDNTGGNEKANLNATKAKRFATPVIVELDGTDTLGAKLSMQLKEVISTSSILVLTPQDVPKLKVLLTTAPEFSSRPGVGSVYSAVWLYYEDPKAFASYLAGEVGIIAPDDVSGLAARLAEKTAGLASRYSYIFN